MEGAIKAIFDALGEIGQKLKQFAEKLTGKVREWASCAIGLPSAKSDGRDGAPHC